MEGSMEVAKEGSTEGSVEGSMERSMERSMDCSMATCEPSAEKEQVMTLSQVRNFRYHGGGSVDT
jgi:hypothetical protein